MQHPPQHQIALPPLRPAAKGMMIACGVLLLVATADPRFALRWLALDPQGFFPWQLLTAVFLHIDPLHLIFNLFALWMFGGPVERHMGIRPFVKFVLFCGVGANLVWWIVNHTRGALIPALGLSGAVYGLLFAFGYLFPNQVVLAFFVFPVKARTFVMFFGGLELWLAMAQPGDGVAHLIHVAGAVVAAIYLMGRPKGLTLRMRHWWAKRKAKKAGKIVIDLDKDGKVPTPDQWN